jgi:hypothetical protein
MHTRACVRACVRAGARSQALARSATTARPIIIDRWQSSRSTSSSGAHGPWVCLRVARLSW